MSQPQQRFAATYMRGGTSKGVFFSRDTLPEDMRAPGAKLDTMLMRLIGSPDPYGKHTDGMGGATSSTSKAVLVGASKQAGFDVDYRFAQVAIDKAKVDWSGNCGNLTAAVGAFAVHAGLISAERIPTNGICEVRIWQENIQKALVVKVPITDGQVQETGDFVLDGVAFPAAKVEVEFVDPVSADSLMFPTKNLVDMLEYASGKSIQATLINAGIPTVFVRAKDLNLSGVELQTDVNSNPALKDTLEQIRLTGAVAMGLSDSIESAKHSEHTPKVAFVSPAQDYVASSGAKVSAEQIDLNVRAMSMGQLHHAMMGTAAVAIAAAAACKGTLVHDVCKTETKPDSITFGHPSGVLEVSAQIVEENAQLRATRVGMARSARRIMQGEVFVPV